MGKIKRSLAMAIAFIFINIPFAYASSPEDAISTYPECFIKDNTFYAFGKIIINDNLSEITQVGIKINGVKYPFYQPGYFEKGKEAFYGVSLKFLSGNKPGEFIYCAYYEKNGTDCFGKTYSSDDGYINTILDVDFSKESALPEKFNVVSGNVVIEPASDGSGNVLKVIDTVPDNSSGRDSGFYIDNSHNEKKKYLVEIEFSYEPIEIGGTLFDCCGFGLEFGDKPDDYAFKICQWTGGNGINACSDNLNVSLNGGRKLADGGRYQLKILIDEIEEYTQIMLIGDDAANYRKDYVDGGLKISRPQRKVLYKPILWRNSYKYDKIKNIYFTTTTGSGTNAGIYNFYSFKISEYNKNLELNYNVDKMKAPVIPALETKASDNPINIMYKGSYLYFVNRPERIENKIYLPLRDMAEALGYSFDFKNDVTLEKDGSVVTIPEFEIKKANNEPYAEAGYFIDLLGISSDIIIREVLKDTNLEKWLAEENSFYADSPIVEFDLKNL